MIFIVDDAGLINTQKSFTIRKSANISFKKNCVKSLFLFK